MIKKALFRTRLLLNFLKTKYIPCAPKHLIRYQSHKFIVINAGIGVKLKSQYLFIRKMKPTCNDLSKSLQNKQLCRYNQLIFKR